MNHPLQQIHQKSYQAPAAVHQPTVQIWAPIIAVAGTIIVCLLIFFAVRHLRIKADVKFLT